MGANRRIVFHRIQELHAGGLAQLTLALTVGGRRVVVRELQPANLLRWRIRKGFINGTRIREQLSDHPNIVSQLERGRRGLVPYEIIEFIDGPNLKRFMQTDAERTRALVFDILRQAALAMAHVHQKGFVHLDIKPENFMVIDRPDGIDLKLTDFDLSTDAKVRQIRRQGGTRAYMPPEMILGGVIGPRADVFAFGVMAYTLLAGRMPFEGKNEKQMRWRQTSESYTLKSPRTVNPEVAEKVDAVIMACLEKRPENRIPDMAILCREMGWM
ncbi:MAG TPA: serine/threonine-protein kinase [Longimicrobiales bacterium]|nr:serine/threonine-protein kinase [Longimicrobiales bacterium]